ncbi:MAG: WXG100 family type VII secretion target [Micromonosporaceae bacterium]|nr:WXG100 family type VII secretion target [Micromonosporaceae bacterium]
MGDTSGVLQYNFVGIEAVASEITNFVNEMNNQLSTLDTEFKGLLADGWEGQAANSFQACSAKWNSGAQQMAQTLQQLSAKVGQASADMASADARNAARFG